MKKPINEKISDALDIPYIENTPQERPVASIVKKQEDSIDDDYLYARDNLKHFIEKGKEAMDEIIYLAKEVESPRAYEVVGQLIKTLSDTNKDLLDLSKKVKELKQKDEEKQPTHVTNALFVGSTAELQKLLKGDG
ncbi:terminase [bacterium]|nr:terminase [bacterium]